jgi:hypothetical protein
MRFFRSSSAVVGAVSAALVLSVAVPASAAQSSTTQRYESYLSHRAATSADARVALRKFEHLSSAQKATFLDLLQDPAVFVELTSVAAKEGTLPAHTGLVSASQVVTSAVAPGILTYRGTVTRGAASPDKIYPSYSTETGRWSWTEQLFGIDITRLNVWVTFNTGYSGVPVKVLSNGSSDANINVFVNVSATDHTPYIQKPAALAVTSTTWSGCALFKGLGACFDKVQTAKFFNGGLYSGTVVNA